MEFMGVIKKKSCGIPMAPVLILALEIPQMGVKTQFCGISPQVMSLIVKCISRHQT